MDLSSELDQHLININTKCTTHSQLNINKASCKNKKPYDKIRLKNSKTSINKEDLKISISITNTMGEIKTNQTERINVNTDYNRDFYDKTRTSTRNMNKRPVDHKVNKDTVFQEDHHTSDINDTFSREKTNKQIYHKYLPVNPTNLTIHVEKNYR
mmetsp:Transcript_9525/g.8385  ORF Transcript_9525/g.8385 Transcript_9525/m.8385 type:complete len:155 (+) Transcript_9525:173-637(+)